MSTFATAHRTAACSAAAADAPSEAAFGLPCSITSTTSSISAALRRATSSGAAAALAVARWIASDLADRSSSVSFGSLNAAMTPANAAASRSARASRAARESSAWAHYLVHPGVDGFR